jgi:DNA polymerase sigma
MDKGVYETNRTTYRTKWDRTKLSVHFWCKSVNLINPTNVQVPIIKFVDTYARIDIDLSFNQTNSLQVVALVQQYLREMPAVRPLVMVLKTLFHQKNLSIPAEGGLGSYSIVASTSTSINNRYAW